MAAAPSSAPAQPQPIAYVTEASPAVPPSGSTPAALTPPLRQETRAAIGGILTPAARTEFTDGLTAEVLRQIDNKCIPVGIAVWIITMIAVARFSMPAFGQGWGLGIAVVAAFVVAGIVTKIMHLSLEDKWVRPIAGLSDEMLVNRYNEARASRTR